MRTAVAALREADPLLRRLIDGYEPFDFRRTERHPFEALLRAIVYQQLSGRSRERHLRAGDGAVRRRPADAAGAGCALTSEQLRAAGLSRAKVLAVHDLAREDPAPRRARAAHGAFALR